MFLKQQQQQQQQQWKRRKMNKTKIAMKKWWKSSLDSKVLSSHVKNELLWKMKNSKLFLTHQRRKILWKMNFYICNYCSHSYFLVWTIISLEIAVWLHIHSYITGRLFFSNTLKGIGFCCYECFLCQHPNDFYMMNARQHNLVVKGFWVSQNENYVTESLQ